jgi:tetratricopeptide (TPR) repeat protein
MKKNLLLLCFLIGTALNSVACLNSYYSLDKEGHAHALGKDWQVHNFMINFSPELVIQKLYKLEKKLKTDKNYMLLSDYSVCLMKLGKQKEALEILQELYPRYPNDYKIASTLGTAFELNGQVDSALKYIKRGIQLNPRDHAGSEWIHVKILETKLELMKNTAYLDDHTVLQLTDKQKNDSITLFQISIQVQERFPFSPGPDAIMARLMTDMGDISANIKSIEHARAYYLIAREYFGCKTDVLNAKIKEMQKLITKYEKVKPPKSPDREMGNEIIGYFNYKDLLKNNDPYHYKINWDKINTDVAALLGMVDFTKTSAEVKKSTLNQSGQAKEELTLIPEEKDSIVKTSTASVPAPADSETVIVSQENSGNTSTWMYLLIAIGIVGVVSVYLMFSRKRKD